MERLTAWDGQHAYIVKCFEGRGCEGNIGEDASKCINCLHYSAVFDRLAAYEDAAEQGLLVRLPCKLNALEQMEIDTYLDARSQLRRCRACGCTEDCACDGGCWWVADDLCSTCAKTENALEGMKSKNPMIDMHLNALRQAEQNPNCAADMRKQP